MGTRNLAQKKKRKPRTTYSESLKLLAQQLGAYWPIINVNFQDEFLNRVVKMTGQVIRREGGVDKGHTFQLEVPTALAWNLAVTLDLSSLALIASTSFVSSTDGGDDFDPDRSGTGFLVEQIHTRR